MERVLHDRDFPGTIEQQIAMCRRQADAGDPSAKIDLELLEQLRDGKLTPGEMNVERVRRLEALKG